VSRPVSQLGRGPGLTRLEVIALAAGLALAAALMWPLRGYITDDTFIHLQYARHLAEGQGPVFNPGERIYGSTSPLWVALLGAAMALGADGLAAARALGAIATLASVALMLQLLRQTVRTPALRAAGTIAWAAHAWMLRWSLSGMEAPLAVAFTLAGFVAFTAGGRWGERAFRTGVLWSLAALTRPEGVFLTLIWGGLLVAGVARSGGLRRLASGALGPILLYGGWLAFAKGYYGTLWPQTLAAKTAGGEGVAYHLQNLWRQARIVGATDGLLAALLLIAILMTAFRPRAGATGERASMDELERWLPWAWVAGLPVLYALRGVPVLSRYVLPLLPILGWLAWRAADRWWVGETPTPGRSLRAGLFATVVMALVVTQNVFVYRTQVVPHVRSFSPALEGSLVEWGRWFERHTARDAVIATPDIGAIGYFSRRRVVDLAGLVTPAMVPHLMRAEPEVTVANFDFATFSRPDYLVDRAPGRYRLLTESRFAPCLTPLGEARVPNLGIARPEPVVYSFYRVDWTVFDSLRDRR
jgi:hypothetical protein